MNRYEYLSERYRKNIATEAEIQELVTLSEKETGVSADTLENPLQHHDSDNAIGAKRPDAGLQNLHERLNFKKHADQEQEKEVVPISRGRNVWWGLAAAAVAILLVVAKELYENRTFRDGQPATEIIAEQTISIDGPNFILLPDSSTVTLNEGSQLVYNESYGVNLREVTLIGEGFFDVKPDADRKFIVRSGSVKTSVLGTAFNVRAYPEDDNIVVTVSRGKVSVEDSKQNFGTIIPNEQMIVNTVSTTCVRTKVNAENISSWTSQFLFIRNEKIEDALDIIESRFNVKITLENKSLEDCRISSTFADKTDLDEVLTVMSTLMNATYSKEDDSITIKGGECR